MIELTARDNTHPVSVGGVMIGGGNQVVVQSMTDTDTADIPA
ncbi:MAG: 4-hydroxy-3-methylbut-2-en-1-yl diphosphate synthase, partial [Chloroflexi bacterium]|nr:4-hydroxy-3-methylbut-2-en-1-yl diphosphate synthase [Chloroflexota bacterium]